MACGWGRHALPAAEHGSDVVAVDSDGEAIRLLEREAERRQLPVKCLHVDLRTSEIASGAFDVVMVFDYLDRERMPDFLNAVRPGGYLLAETYLEGQQEMGWGPQSEDHLLKPGELLRLAEPFEVFLFREVLEMIDGRPAVVASILAQRPSE
jgi:cyclopropane fatty-acyl-phospholipid synthase-like methyltransferase